MGEASPGVDWRPQQIGGAIKTALAPMTSDQKLASCHLSVEEICAASSYSAELLSSTAVYTVG